MFRAAKWASLNFTEVSNFDKSNLVFVCLFFHTDNPHELPANTVVRRKSSVQTCGDNTSLISFVTPSFDNTLNRLINPRFSSSLTVVRSRSA